MAPSLAPLSKDVLAYREHALTSPAWPFEEARKLLARVQATGQKSVLFETGYGPSGLPHIGTFGEVARTSMVRTAFRLLSQDQIPTRLLAFSDDMDGLRKVPDNVPNKDKLQKFIGRPLTQVPDPFEQFESFAHHNNAKLRHFLDHFGFEYEFASATDYYQSGRFDSTLLFMLENFEQIQEVMLPSLRQERSATYSPFLPLHPSTGCVMQVPLEERRPEQGTIIWKDPETQQLFETPVTGGHCKLQWKPDWAMRWFALQVDYEMAGKDLIDSVKLSSEILRRLGKTPPEIFIYELFLDEKGQKISKSKGNGLTLEEWLTYAGPESLSLFMYHRPREAKRLYFDVIPRQVDDYFHFLRSYPSQSPSQKLTNPVWHLHQGAPPPAELLAPSEEENKSTPLTFGMLLNLATVANSDSPHVLWGFVQRYAPHLSPKTHPIFNHLIQYALAYFRNFVRSKKAYRLPDEIERDALLRLDAALKALPEGEDSPHTFQTLLYDVARPLPRYQDFKAKGATPERPGVSNAWFSMLYEVLLGEKEGPRFGSFIALYGREPTRQLIHEALEGRLAP